MKLLKFMQQEHLTNICKAFDLGSPTHSAMRVHGGLLHLMWRINTDKGSYAVKQLSQDIDLNNERVRRNYELSEYIAFRFMQQHIPAVCAISHDNQYLFETDRIGFLVYPWVNAEPLHKDRVSEFHALRIGEVIAKIHLIHLNVPEITEPEFDIHSNSDLLKLFQKAEDCHCPFAARLIENQNIITTVNTTYQNTIVLLKKRLIVSHGDLDQKNVLWDNNNEPILIDWECARKLNPTYEIVNAALDWSGITSDFDRAIFIKMMQTYSTSGGNLDKSLLQAAFNAVLGNWINWMVYNIERSCTSSESEQKTLGIEQVNQTLATILRLRTMIPELIDKI